MSDKIKVKTIQILAAEGDGRGPLLPVTVTDWSLANRVLRSLADYAPIDGSYHKVDFLITFADDNFYKGTYELGHWSLGCPNLQDHVWTTLAIYAGRYKPAWAIKDPAKWSAWVTMNRENGNSDRTAAVLERYAICPT